MVYKKYILKRGKLHGPYYYESYREDGKVKKRYIGTKLPKRKRVVPHLKYGIFGILLILILFGLFFVLKYDLLTTGRVSLDFGGSYEYGERLSGNVRFNLREGELIPKDSIVKVSLGEEVNEFKLSDLIDSDIVSGEFYAENSGISGSGEGYGLIGKRQIYPEISFELLIFGAEEVSVGGGEVEEEGGKVVEKQEEKAKNVTEEVSEEIIEEAGNITEEVPEIVEEIPEEIVQEPPEEAEVKEKVEENVKEKEKGSITGKGVSENEEIVSGRVSKDKDFIYELEVGEDVKVALGSVKINGEEIDEDSVKLKVRDNKVEISTEYSEVVEGFGEEYLGNKKLRLEVELDRFNISVKEESLKVELVYNGIEIVSADEEVSIESVGELEKEEIEEAFNVTEEQNATLNVSLEEPENVTVVNVSNLSFVKDIQMIRIVKNGSAIIDLSENFVNVERYELIVSNLSASFDGNIMTIIPDLEFSGARKGKVVAYAGNNSIESNEFNILVSAGAVEIITSREKIVVGKPVKWVKNVSLDVPENVTIELEKGAENITVKKIVDGVEEEASASITGAVISGEVTAEIHLDKKSKIAKFFDNLFMRITGRVVEEVNASEGNVDGIVEVILDENVTEYVIEYYTEAPQAFEEDVSNGKKVVITGPDELNYTDVLAFSNIEEKYKIGEEGRIKVYWVEGKGFIDFDAYDLSGNDMLDYIEWQIPYLSNQTYEIILITKAEHLNESRDFIEDVYGLVKTRDQNWTEPIPAGHYVRVTFEKNLTSEKDITLYARSSISGASVEVYEENGTELIASFPEINEDKEYKIYLTNLVESQDVFDLKVVGGSVEFDWIVDPTGQTTCGTLNVANNVYNLLNSVTDVDTCFTVTANNITLNGQGNTTIIYNTGAVTDTAGVYVNGANGTIIKNVHIEDGSDGTNRFAVWLQSSHNVTVYNVSINHTFSVGTENCPGINVQSSTYFNLTGNNVTTNSNGCSGFNITASSDGYISGNTIVTQGINSKGIILGGASQRNNFTNNLIHTTGSSNVEGIWLQDTSSSNSFSGMTVKATAAGQEGIVFVSNGATNNVFYDSLVDVQANGNNTLFFAAANVIANFTNVTLVENRTAFLSANGTLNVHWHFEAQVNNSNGVIQNANVSAWDVNNAIRASVLTGSNGFISKQGLLEYKKNGTATIYYTNYTVNASRTGYTTATVSLNITTNTFYGFVLTNNLPLVTINFPARGANYSASNLPLNFNVSLNENGSVIYSLNGGTNNVSMTSTDENSKFGLLFNGTNGSIADGSYTFSVYANDTAGGNNYTESATFRFDTTPPNLVIVVPANTSYNTESLQINFTVSDSVSGVNTGQCRYDDGSGNVTLTNCANTSYTRHHGSTILRLYAQDYSGNWNNTAVVTFTVNSSLKFFEDCNAIGEWVRSGAQGWTVSSNVCESVSAGSSDNMTSSRIDLSGMASANLTVTASTSGLDAGEYFRIWANSSSDSWKLVLELTGANSSATYVRNLNQYITLGGFVYLRGECLADSGSETCTWDNINITALTDTTVPTVNLLSPTNGTTVTTNITFFFASFTDNVNVSNATLYLWNQSGTLIATNFTALGNASISANRSLSLNQTGTFFWNYLAVDVNNNQAFNNSNYTLVYDSFPLVTINFPANTTYSASNLPLNFNVSLNENGSVIYSLNGGINNISMTSTDENSKFGKLFNHTNGSIADGSYTFSVYANDTAGNKNYTHSVTFSLDQTSPLVTVISPTAGQNFSSMPIQFNISTNENSTANYTLNGGITNYTMSVNASGTGFNATNSSIADGSYTVRYYVWDIRGNFNGTETRLFGVDATKPLISYGVGTENDGANFSRTNVYVNVSVTETNFANISYTLRNDTATINTTTYTTLVRTINWTGLSDANYTYNVSVRDTANNFNSTATRKITLDTTFPLVTINLPEGKNHSSSSINFNVTLNEDGTSCLYSLNSGVANITMQKNGNRDFNATNNSIADGQYTVNYYCNDTTGNLNASTSRGFGVDATKPLISYGVGTENDGANFSRTNVYVNVSVTETNENTITFRLHNSTSQVNVSSYTNSQRTINWTGLVDGVYTYNVTVNDTVGNSNTTATRTITLDTTIPIINYVSPTETDGSFVSRNYIQINVTSTDTNLANITIRLYNSSRNQIEINSSTSSPLYINYSSLSNGVYYFNASTRDTANNLNESVTRNVTLDTVFPGVTINLPEGKNHSSSSINFNVTLNEDGTSCLYSLNSGTTNITMTNNGNRDFNATNNSIADGQYTVNYYCNDTTGNLNASTSRGFGVDTVRPGVTVNSPSGTITTSSVNFNVTTSEWVSSCLYSLNSGAVNITMTNNGNRDFNATNSSIVNGDYTVNYYCNDSANNLNGTSQSAFTISVSSGGGSSGSSGGSGGSTTTTQSKNVSGEESKPGVVSEIEIATFEVGVNTIERRVDLGEEIFENILIRNTGQNNATISILVDKSLAELVFVNNLVEILPRESKSFRMRIFGKDTGVYMGNVYFFGKKITETIDNVEVSDASYVLPMRIIVKSRDDKFIDLRAVLDKREINAGEELGFELTAFNLGKLDNYDFNLSYEIVDNEGNSLVKESEILTIVTSLSLSRKIEVPGNLTDGDYELLITVSYDDKSNEVRLPFIVGKSGLRLSPLFNDLYVFFKSGKIASFIALYLPIILAVLFSLILLIVVIYYFGYLRKKLFEKKMEEKKRQSIYVFPDFKLLPTNHFAYIGHVADSGVKTYLDYTQLNRHTLVAGGTGSGKTVSGMVIAEELLKKNYPVVVFDPVGQWTGFSEKNKDKRMRSLYRKFSMEGPRAFKTRIIGIDDKTMNINIIYYLNKNGLTVFDLSKLSPDKLDSFIENSLERIYRANHSETGSLKSLVVLDEVHRLLPKYGGRKAHIKLEQAVREFRKWGIGLLMISQVLTDFKGAIRGNIGTEIQMRTRYEGDIKRVKERHGSKISKLIAKLPTSLGSVESSEYNRGNPYFVEFRPLLHSQFKLGAKELQGHFRKAKVVLVKGELFKEQKSKKMIKNKIDKLAKKKEKEVKAKLRKGGKKRK